LLSLILSWTHVVVVDAEVEVEAVEEVAEVEAAL
jgi:hypothetical protein